VVDETNGNSTSPTGAERRTPPHEARGYFIAPDSDEPWPDAVWERVDPKVVERAVARVVKRERSGSPDAKSEFATPRGFVVQKRDRDVLRAVGGPASLKALRRLAK
jgi:hypothetical protein